jgi:hypothetical protein
MTTARRGMNVTELAGTLTTLFGELLEGPPPSGAYMLNRGDVGLLRSLDKLTAAAASTSVHGGASIAAHVDHLRYHLWLLNRWVGGEHPDPWYDADWTASWRRGRVTDEEWQRLRADLASEARRWQQAIAAPREVDEADLNYIIGGIAHLAYHMGAIRQIDRSARGPLAEEEPPRPPR